MNEYPLIKIKKDLQNRLAQGSPWVYSNEILNFSQVKNLLKGTIVEIAFERNQSFQKFALGYFNPHSLISARILTYNLEEKIDEEYFINRISSALLLRNKFFNQPYYRLIHSEGDFLPGLVIDRYNEVFVCQISTAGMEQFSELITKSLLKIFGEKITIIYKNDSDLRTLENLENNCIIAHGSVNDKVKVEEDGITFFCDVIDGQKTGWFFDQRINHKFVQDHSKNLKVLDAFCYLGGFGINAIKGQAKQVVFVDSSAKAIELAKSNCKLFTDNSNHQFQTQKVFDYLEQNKDLEEKFDFIILDPPAFIKNKKDLFSGLKGYEKLVKLSLDLLNKNSLLMLNSCSHHAKVSDLIDCVKNACYKNNKKAKLIRQSSAGIDHPIHLALKENEYLKSLTFLIS